MKLKPGCEILYLLPIILLIISGCGQTAGYDYAEKITGMKFVKITAGTFIMGSQPGESAGWKWEDPHRVTITKDFYMGIYEVTQCQWEKIMGYNPSYFTQNGQNRPVENINWYEVQKFIIKLNKLTGEKFRLPTEAEWEYACRAGTTTPFNTGENLTNYYGSIPYKNFPKGTARKGTMTVGSFAPNAWGLYDMHGNVWEWCEDWYCPYPDSAVTDPVGNCNSEYKVIRGGSWYFNAESARSGRRYTHNPHDRGFSLGFRLVKEI